MPLQGLNRLHLDLASRARIRGDSVGKRNFKLLKSACCIQVIEIELPLINIRWIDDVLPGLSRCMQQELHLVKLVANVDRHR